MKILQFYSLYINVKFYTLMIDSISIFRQSYDNTIRLISIMQECN